VNKQRKKGRVSKSFDILKSNEILENTSWNLIRQPIAVAEMHVRGLRYHRSRSHNYFDKSHYGASLKRSPWAVARYGVTTPGQWRGFTAFEKTARGPGFFQVLWGCRLGLARSGSASDRSSFPQGSLKLSSTHAWV